MATPSRTAQIARTLKVLRKHYKPAGPPPKDRSLLEHLLFACLLEDSPQESAEHVFAALKRHYFDWNEIRVSTIRELTEALKSLVNPAESAARFKQALQSVFETVYQFDIETLRKQNIGQSVKQLQKYNGTTPFTVAYVTQMALGGHAIPVSRGALIAFHTVRVISDDEFAKAVVPGLERAVSKSKGLEVGSLVHQLGVEVGRNPYGQAARKLLLEIDPSCKDRLPKRSTGHAQPGEAAADVAPAQPKPTASAKAEAAPKKSPEGKTMGRAPAQRPPAERPKKSPEAKKPKAAKRTSKPTKKPTKHGTKSTAGSRLAKRKPR